MKRTFATTTFAFAILGVAACKGGAGDAAKYIPEAATVVGGVNIAAVQESQPWKDNKGMLESQGKEVLDAMSACNLGLDKWKSVTFGVDPNSPDEKMAAVVVADGLGKKENLDCAAGKLKEKVGEDPWTAEEDGKVLKMKDGTVAYVVNENTLAVAGKGWAEDVKKLTAGEGKSAFDGSLKDVIGRTDTSKHIWFAGLVPDSAKGMAKAAGDVGDPKDVAGWMDVGSGLEVFLAVGFASGDEATKAKDAGEAAWTGFKGMIGQFGVPQGVIDSVKFDTSGNAATVTAKASSEDLTAIQAKVKEQMGGMM
ncbi:MAG: hypothetical protein KDK70_25115 [Myxococcales bacterium]|nr:hypothetical protein [Myxococcales bacterium]